MKIVHSMKTVHSAMEIMHSSVKIVHSMKTVHSTMKIVHSAVKIAHSADILFMCAVGGILKNGAHIDRGGCWAS